MTEKSLYAYRYAQIPVRIRGLVSVRSPYAHGDQANPRMHTGIKINPSLHTGITSRSPCAYGDYMTCDPRMHTGITFAVPVCIRGLILIPICIRGSHVMLSPNAYGDHDVIPVCIRGFARSPYAFVVLHGADCHRSRRQWWSSSNAAAVDIVGGNGGLSPQRSLSTEAAVGWS